MNENSKKKKRLVWFWFVGVLGIVLISFIVQLVYGYFLTINYTPDITEVYQDVNILQNEISVGLVVRGLDPLIWIVLVAVTLFSVIIYRKYSVLN